MSDPIILASSSSIRSQLLQNAGVNHRIVPARIDEDQVKRSLDVEGATARDVADCLAELKARKISEKEPEALTLGCDQVLSSKTGILSKAPSIAEARQQLQALRGETHQLLSAAVIYQGGKPLWRHVGVARLTMRDFSDSYLDAYLDRNWDSIRWSVGGYKIEEEGIRLFSAISGDYPTIQGLPLIPLLSYLTISGTLDL